MGRSSEQAASPLQEELKDVRIRNTVGILQHLISYKGIHQVPERKTGTKIVIGFVLLGWINMQDSMVGVPVNTPSRSQFKEMYVE